MKYIIALLILNLTFCLQVEKSPFDLNTGGGVMFFGLIFALTNSTPRDINDINGDGFADLVVAAPSYGSNNGRVYVFNGTATGISQTDAANANQTLEGTAGRKFGSSVAMIDINADGFSDLVVCQHLGLISTASPPNSAFYYLGSPNGLGSQIIINQVSTVNTQYCASMVVADFNNDGYGDVAIADAAITTNGGNGNIYIYRGGANGLNTTAAEVIILNPALTNLGQILAVGDINGDGWMDLVSSFSSPPQIISLHNSPSGFTNSIASSIINVTATSNIILGDFNNDGKDDLAVGCNGQCASSGGASPSQAVQIFYSNGTTLNTTPNARIQELSVSDSFAPANLAVGDINLDGITDLVVGDDKGTYPSTLYGKIYVFHGSFSGICNTACNASTLANVQITGDASLKLGKAVGLIDLNNDGYPDLVSSAITDPNNGARNGTLYIFHGIASGITVNSVSGASQTIIGTNGSGEQFGTSFY